MKATGRLYKLWATKEYEDLISLCNLMLDKNPNDYLAFYYRGLGNEMLKQFDLAIDDFKTSESLLTTNKFKNLLKEYFTRIPIQISRIYRKKQDKEKTFDYADKSVKADKEEIDGLKWRSSLKEEIGDYIGAVDDINEALRRKPNNKILIKMKERLIYIIIQKKRETASS